MKCGRLDRRTYPTARVVRNESGLTYGVRVRVRVLVLSLSLTAYPVHVVVCIMYCTVFRRGVLVPRSMVLLVTRSFSFHSHFWTPYQGTGGRVRKITPSWNERRWASLAGLSNFVNETSLVVFQLPSFRYCW